MTYLASISLIQEVTTRNGSTNQNTNTNTNNTLISILILVKLLPNVFFLPTGGILADSYDRRTIQVVLDLSSSCVVVVFLWSLAKEPIVLCLVANSFPHRDLFGIVHPEQPSHASTTFYEFQEWGGEGQSIEKK